MNVIESFNMSVPPERLVIIEQGNDLGIDYQRAIDACKAMDSMPLADIDQAPILGLQERIYKKRGRWLANMVVSVVLGWGVPRGLTDGNATAGVPKTRRPRGSPKEGRS